MKNKIEFCIIIFSRRYNTVAHLAITKVRNKIKKVHNKIVLISLTIAKHAKYAYNFQNQGLFTPKDI